MSFNLDSMICATKENSIARVLVTDHKGSAPRESGTSMIVSAQGIDGTIGGGALELEAIKLAHRVLETGKNIFQEFPLGPALGQCCGGSVTLFIEHIEHSVFSVNPAVFARPIEMGVEKSLTVQRLISQMRNGSINRSVVVKDGWVVERLAKENTKLWLYGAGHVGRALVDALEGLAFDITWVDTSLDRFPKNPKASPMVAIDPARTVAFAPKDAHHIIMTYSHKFDLEICNLVLKTAFGSIGLIGSATKWVRFQRRLSELGHSQSQIAKIKCPIGNPILGKEPKAIAIGIASELLCLNNVKDHRGDLAL